MEREELVDLWAKVIGGAPPRRLGRALLRHILAFEIQARHHGGPPAALQKKLAAFAKGGERPKSPKLKPGGRLIREWNGVSHIVDVTDDGFVWRGERYRSLSAVAREITGAHWSGPRFFGLIRRSGE